MERERERTWNEQAGRGGDKRAVEASGASVPRFSSLHVRTLRQREGKGPGNNHSSQQRTGASHARGTSTRIFLVVFLLVIGR